MTAILKVDTIQDTSGNNIINESSDTITIGASGDTISIPSGATIANSGTATGFGGGIVKQVIYANTATNVTFTNATYGDVITINITPTKTTSDILIQANMQLKSNSTTSQDQGTGFKILRDSTEILISGGYQQYIYSNGANIDKRDNFSIAYLDTAHNTTSQITYKIQGNNNTGGGSLTFNDAGKSTIWVMELDQ